VGILRPFLGPRSGAVPSGDFLISGPYAADFTPVDTVKTQLHCHTTGSFDGSILPSVMVSNYVSAGYGALALTDHDVVTTQPAGASYAIQGNELTTSGQHVISINSDYVRGAETNAQNWINAVVADGGQAHIAHPNWSAGMSLTELSTLTGHMGFEIHNGHCINGAGQNPISFPGFAVTRWDEVLATGKRAGVWGFAVDDLHAVGAYDTYDMGCVKVFVDANSTAGVLDSLDNGYFVADVANFGVTPGYPVIGATDVSLSCTGATAIEAYGRSGLISSAAGTDLTVDFPFDGSSGYLRFEAVGDYTEGFSSALSDRWGTVDGTWTVGSGNLSVNTDATFRRIILRRHRRGDFTAQTDIKLSAVSTDDAGALMFNVLNSSVYMMVRIGPSSIASFSNKLTLSETTNGSFTSPLASTSFTATTGTWYTLKIDYVRTTGRMRAKVWETGTAEPDWMITATSTTWGWGGFGYRANRQVAFDNLHIDGFRTFYQPIFIDPA
jgi:hypothetical protein